MRKILLILLAMSLFCAPALADGAVEGLTAGSAIDETAEQLEPETPEEILTGAMEIYSWFAMRPLDTDELLPNADGTSYRVLDDRFNTPDTMRALLESYFSAEICDELMSSGVYMEENGYLYTNTYFGEIDPCIADIEYVLTEKTDTAEVYTATVLYSETEGEITNVTEYSYLREKIDDRWVFTEFWFIW